MFHSVYELMSSTTCRLSWVSPRGTAWFPLSILVVFVVEVKFPEHELHINQINKSITKNKCASLYL